LPGAQIARQIESTTSVRKLVGARAAGVRYALYRGLAPEDHASGINYPEWRGRIYGSLRLTVSINSDGTLAAMDLGDTG
jgi:hypothetical protein